jgi:hypothetical protein
MDSTKRAMGHDTPNFVFLHPMGFVHHIVRSCACGTRNGDTLFFMLGWDRMD